MYIYVCVNIVNIRTFSVLCTLDIPCIPDKAYIHIF